MGMLKNAVLGPINRLGRKIFNPKMVFKHTDTTTKNIFQIKLFYINSLKVLMSELHSFNEVPVT